MSLIGTQIAQYRIVARLGAGGMGEVYRAVDDNLREVAIKVMSARALADPQAVSRFVRDARAAAAIKHPGIVAVHDILVHEGRSCIVMELVQGRTLDVILSEDGPLPVERALRLCSAAADALAVAHEAGIVHRDLKPASFMITRDDQIKVLDLGFTNAAARAGTLGYGAPELARGEPADARSDIFSLGCLLYALCVGHSPFPDPAPVAVLAAIEARRWARPSTVAARGLAIALDAVIDRALAPVASARWATMREMADAMRWIANDRATSKKARGGATTFGLVVSALAGMILGAGSGVAYWRPHQRTIAAPTFALGTKPPLVVGDKEDNACVLEPSFTSDGGLLYVVRKGAEFRVHRRELVSGADRELVKSAGENRTPIAGPGGSVIYQHADVGSDRVDLFRALAGGASERIKERAGQAVFVGGHIYYVRDDYRAVRRLSLDGTSDELVYESASSTGFGAMTVSADGRMFAARQLAIETRPTGPICVGPATADGAALDCSIATDARSNPVFADAKGDALYYSRGAELVRYTLRTRYVEKLTLPRPATGIAISPDGKHLAASDCQPSWVIATLTNDGHLTTLPTVTNAIGNIAVGPRGELAFPTFDQGRSDISYVTTDAATGARTARDLATGAQITEAAFSLNGIELAFHDAGAGGGLFVVGVAGDRAARRLTDHAEDSAPVWVGADELEFQRPEAGFPYGRAYRISINGGAATAMEALAGVPIGYDATRSALVLWAERPTGDQFFVRYDATRVEPLHVETPTGWKVERFLATSPNGRYLTTFGGGAVWLIDTQTGKTQRIPYGALDGDEQTVQADDDGKLTISYKRHRGGLWLLDGDFH